MYSSTSGNCCGEDPVEELLPVVVETTPTREPLMMLTESVEVAEIAAEFGGSRWDRKLPPPAPARVAADDGAIVVSTPAVAEAEPAMRCCHAAAQMSSRKRRRMAPVAKPVGSGMGCIDGQAGIQGPVREPVGVALGGRGAFHFQCIPTRFLRGRHTCVVTASVSSCSDRGSLYADHSRYRYTGVIAVVSWEFPAFSKT